jgi:hypothetical protein
MKALSMIAMFFAAFLIFLGVTSRQTAGEVLGNAVIAGGVIITVVVVSVWTIMFFKRKKENN